MVAGDGFKPSIRNSAGAVVGQISRGEFYFPGELQPLTLAVMPGSSYIGKGEKLLTDLAGVIRENFNNGQ